MPRVAHWKMIQHDYARRILHYVEQVKQILQPLLNELPSLISSANTERQFYKTIDSVYSRRDAGESQRIKAAIDRARQSLQSQISTSALERIAEEFANKTSDFNKVQLAKQVRAVLGVDVLPRDTGLASKMQTFVAENVAMIKSVPDDLINDIEKTIYRGLSKGILASDLAKQLTEEFDYSENRASLIARDQIGSFYGQLNAERQQSIGVKRFIWRTMHDERVRSEHADREEASDPAQGGTPYEYDDPPDGELPGEPINCRCYAEPVLSDILDEV